MRAPRCTARSQRGAAALIVTMLLFFAMVLVAMFVNRNLVFEQRSAANQYRSTQAFEAAEAGLEWALAQLNGNRRVGPDCRPTTDPAATSFRTRYLSFDRAGATFTPVTWLQAGAAAALQPTCVRSGSGWACNCPTQGLPTLSAPAGTAPVAAFTLRFLATGKPGIVRVASTGCTSLAGTCLPSATTSADTIATVEIAVGLLAGLRTSPAAAITARGAFDADTAPLGVHNPDPATGIAIHAGSAIAAAHTRLTTPAGATRAGALISNDMALARLSADRLFVSYFGIDKAGWKNLPAVTAIDCRSDCSAALAAAIGAAADTALIWVDGDLALAGPITLGSVEQPIVIIVSGVARFEGAIALNGVIYSAGMRWNNTSGGAYLRGAAISEDGYEGNGAAEFFYDAGVLATLRANSGSFVRVNGSGRDF